MTFPLTARSRRLVAAAAAFALSSFAHAEPVRVPATAVSIDPPAGFTLAERFSGIVDEARLASVQVVELPAPVADMRDDMNAASLTERGLTLVEREEVEAGIDNALLLELGQAAGGVDYSLWILLGGNDEETVLLTARAPAPVDDALASALREALIGATWAPDVDIDPLESLSFSLEPVDGLEVAQVMMGSTVLLSLEGRSQSVEPGEPFMIVAQSIREQPVDDLMAYAEERLERTDGVERLEIQERRESEIDGMPAVELVAKAFGENGIESIVHQTLMLDDGGYLIAQGHVAAGAADDWLDTFTAIAASIRRRVD